MRLAAFAALFALVGCQSLCAAFPEWDELGYQNDVEHNAAGQVEYGLPKLAGQLAEVVVDPACYVGSKLGIVSKH